MPLATLFEQLWNSANSSNPAPSVFEFLRQHGATDSDQILAVLLFDQQRRWLTDHPLKVEDYLASLPDLPGTIDWKLQLAIGEFEARRKTSRPLSINEISSRFPDLGDTLRERLEKLTASERAQSGRSHAAADPMATVIEVQHDGTSTATYISNTGIGVEHRGRYRLDRILGEGSFGRVYLGFDEELQRQVAIKVPTKARFSKPEDTEAYLAEARTVASLERLRRKTI